MFIFNFELDFPPDRENTLRARSAQPFPPFATDQILGPNELLGQYEL